MYVSLRIILLKSLLTIYPEWFLSASNQLMCQQYTKFTFQHKLRWKWKPSTFGIKLAIEECLVILGCCRATYGWKGNEWNVFVARVLFVTTTTRCNKNIFNYSNSKDWLWHELSMWHRPLHKWICVFHVTRCTQQLVSVFGVQYSGLLYYTTSI